MAVPGSTPARLPYAANIPRRLSQPPRVNRDYMKSPYSAPLNAKSIPFDQIMTIIMQRRMQDTTLMRQMIDVRDRVNGDTVIPLPDVDGEPVMTPPMPRLVADAIEGHAMRAAAPRADIWCPVSTAKYAGTKNALEKAQADATTRRRALESAWHHSALWDILLYRSYRHLIAYGTNSLIVTPDFRAGRARVEIRDPLTAYPELRSPDDVRAPMNCGFVFGRSREWLVQNYPESRQFLENAQGRAWDTLWDVVEWIDENEIVVGILGPRMPAYGPQEYRVFSLGYYGYELRRWANKAGMVPVACPRRVTLDRIQGQLAALIGMYDLLGKLTALDVIAAEKAIFPDMVALGKDGRPPALISGTWRDGRTGDINLLTDSDVKLLQAAPGPLTHPVLDRLEAAIRGSGGPSPFMGGETTGSLRTGKAIDTLGNYSIDPRIEEAQKIMARGLMVVNESIMAVEEGYFPAKSITAFSGWATDDEVVEYTPSAIFYNKENVVRYPFAGADIAQISVTIGQLVGAGLMSKATARRLHPYIENGDQEAKLAVEEGIDNAVIAGFLNQATSGQLPMNDAIRVKELLDGGKGIVEAIQTAHDEAQKRQAAQAPPPGEGQGAAPEQMPGLAAPGMGVESQAPPPAIGGPNASQQDFRKLILAMNAGKAE